MTIKGIAIAGGAVALIAASQIHSGPTHHTPWTGCDKACAAKILSQGGPATPAQLTQGESAGKLPPRWLEPKPPPGPNWHPAWVKRYLEPVLRPVGPNGLPIPPKPASASSSSTSTTTSTTKKPPPPPSTNPAVVKAMKTKCSNGSVTAATCARYGLPGGR